MAKYKCAKCLKNLKEGDDVIEVKVGRIYLSFNERLEFSAYTVKYFHESCFIEK